MSPTDLASRWLGGGVVAASDESFGDKENLLNPAAAAFEPGRYSNRGEIVDGWETRRRRRPGHDWAIVRLGTPGIVSAVNVDTSFFTGNNPQTCMVHACGREGYPGPDELEESADWVELVPRSPVRGNAQNLFAVTDPRRFTHVRLSVFPDGGVARLRVLGLVVPDPRPLDQLTVDLASQAYGAAVVASSDDFYSAAQVLNRPDRARSMGEGWETRRRRDAGNDFVVIQLAFAGQVRQMIVDTSNFKYNASESVAVYGSAEDPAPDIESPTWMPLLPRTRLQSDTRHHFTISDADDAVISAIRLDAFPDGGMSRVRAIGKIDTAARRRAGYRWFNSLPSSQAMICLTEAGVPAPVAADVADRRPLPEDWLDRHGWSDGATMLTAAVTRTLAVLLEGHAGATAAEESDT